MDHVTIRVPRELSDAVWRGLSQRWRVSRSQAVDHALAFYLQLKVASPDLPLTLEQPYPLLGGVEVWVQAATADRARELLLAHRRANPDAPRISLGALTQTALHHALESLRQHGHVEPANVD